MITEFDKAYAAGYVDGDGCFYIGTYTSVKSNIYEYSVQVSSVKKESVNWLKEKFGGFVRKKETGGNRRIPYVWTVKGKTAIEFVEQIQPYIVGRYVESQIFVEFGLHVINNNYLPLDADAIDHRLTLIKNIRKAKHEWYQISKNESTQKWKNILPSISPSEKEIAYLAGLIDAEGCFRVKKWKPKDKPNHVYAITLEIGNTQKHFFQWLLMRFGGGITFVPAKSENRKDSATWSLSAKKLFYCIHDIAKFLIIKQAVCNKIIEFHETIIPNGGDRHSECFKKMYADVISTREKIISEIHILNKKGHSKSLV